MEKRHIQTFLTVSAVFFAMSLPARQAQAGMVATAVSRTIAKAGIGAGPAERWAAAMGDAPARRTPIAHASRKHLSTIETASAKAARTSEDATEANSVNAAPFSLM
ncbi:hypothetical protein [Trinickia diaoshuihuensis]|jgi:hypothetical protein|uniref:hypothetical protein n=1 Tax=Trinickia diaoshuihuensis TaxID=2292265 RepID=UPI000E278732|nr:hypothetical protein [Trinickia diaoshuihuensis]